MTVLQDIQKLAVKRKADIRPGNTVRVHQKIKEGGKERIQIFEGLVIKMNSGYGADKTFTVRKVVEGIGVEKIFPLYSKNITKIEVKKKSKVRRAKLYYMRERFGKSARLKGRSVKKGEGEVEEDEEILEEKTEERDGKNEVETQETSEKDQPEKVEEKVEKAEKPEETTEEKAETPEEQAKNPESEEATPQEDDKK